MCDLKMFFTATLGFFLGVNLQNQTDFLANPQHFCSFQTRKINIMIC